MVYVYTLYFVWCVRSISLSSSCCSSSCSSSLTADLRDWSCSTSILQSRTHTHIYKHIVLYQSKSSSKCKITVKTSFCHLSPLSRAQMFVDQSLLLDDWQLQVHHLMTEKVQTLPLLLKFYQRLKTKKESLKLCQQLQHFSLLLPGWKLSKYNLLQTNILS